MPSQHNHDGPKNRRKDLRSVKTSSYLSTCIDSCETYIIFRCCVVFSLDAMYNENGNNFAFNNHVAHEAKEPSHRTIGHINTFAGSLSDVCQKHNRK